MEIRVNESGKRSYAWQRDLVRDEVLTTVLSGNYPNSSIVI